MAILKYFSYSHLQQPARDLSQQFHDMAHFLVDELPEGPETAVALRKLLEAKDAAVRSLIVDGGPHATLTED